MISDPQAIRFTNEVVRPLAEDLRALVARIQAAQTTWFGGMNLRFPNDAGEELADGREAEGVSRLTGADVNSLVGVALAMAGQSNSEIIAKPCVRTLQVN